MKYIFALLFAFAFTFEASAASLIPVGTLAAIGTSLTDTFTEAVSWAFPIMITFVGGFIGLQIVKKMTKAAAS